MVDTVRDTIDERLGPLLPALAALLSEPDIAARLQARGIDVAAATATLQLR
jgi:hypothetical protein